MARTRTAFLFDLDGTLVDSVYQHVLAWKWSLDQEGVPLSVWRIHRKIGMSGGLFTNILLRETGFDATPERLERLRREHAEEYTRLSAGVKPLPGARELLAYLTAEKIPWAIATSGRMETAQHNLTALGVDPNVTPVVTRDQVRYAKPDPDLFVTAAERLGVDIHDSLVLGDSIWDMIAAQRARALGVGLLSGGSLPDGRVVDVAIAGGTVIAVGAPGTVAPGPGETLDVAGYVLLPAPAEPHAHLDKALTWDAIEPPAGDLRSAIESFRAFAAEEPESGIEDRATRALERMLAAGTTAVRSHVNFFGGDDPLRAFRALAEVRRRFAGLVDLQLVALPAWDTPTALIEQAMSEGADLIGGAPHLSPDPIGDLTRLLDLAERLGSPVDLHTDEGLDGPVTLAAYAERTRDWPVLRSAGHCVRLGTLPAAELDPVVAAVHDADIGIISLPITNLYLQGWQSPVATPRGLTALRALLDGGVRVAAGADNLRDPFNPMGRGDALETASLLVTAGHLSIAEAVHAVTNGARSVLGLPEAGPAAGASADLLAVRAASLADAVAFAPADRFVLTGGRLVASTSTVTTIASPAARTEVRS